MAGWALTGGRLQKSHHMPPIPCEDLNETPMPKMRKKSDLPTKTCVVCGLPFAWRKKWARDWENVSHCSDRCRSAAKPNRPAAKP